MRSRFLFAFVAALIFSITTLPSSPAQDRIRQVVGTPNNQFLVVNGHPEYWVDGKPFFEHAAAFFYHRIPRDRWAEELSRLKSMGINTIDLYPMWNWHQPEEGVLDFDGHTSPRRDLMYLLRLIDAMGFKLTFRPGPFFCSEWRNGGYPDWLLRRSDYGMSEQAILEGRYPRLSALQYDKSEEAATGFLKNDTHLKYTRQWYQDVLGLVRAMLAEHGGPLINIQLDDDQAIGFENYNGPNFWKYMDKLREFAEEATGRSPIPYYINGRDMRENAEANEVLPEPFWNTGQDYMDNSPSGISSLQEAAKNKFLTEILKTQPLFVPMHIEFQAGWLGDEKDTYAMATDPSNTLMATRVMFQNGMKGLNYYPLHDTLYPAGYEAQWGNHFYTWESAVNYAGQETGRAVPVRRNGRLIAGMGPLLASSHLVADAGLVYPIGTFPQAEMTPEEARYIAAVSSRVLWSGAYDHFNFELIDADHIPAENLKKYRVLLLPNMASTKEELKRFPHLEKYSEKAQRLIADYVEAGGTLVVFPSLPKGKVFEEMLAPLGESRVQPADSALKFSDGTAGRALGARSTLALPKKRHVEVKPFATDARGGIVGARFSYGQGQVLFFGADFSRWSAAPATSPSFGGGDSPAGRDYSEENQKAGRAALAALMKEAGLRRAISAEMETSKARDVGLYVTELVSDPREERDKNPYAFVGVTNFSPDESRAAEIVLTDPRAAGPSESALRLPRLTLPPRESLMLPVRVPLSNPYWELAPGLAPDDEVVYATSELSRVAYDGAALKLEFTAPSDGEVALRLSQRPRGATIDGADATVQEDSQRGLYVVRIPQGDAPHFMRTVELAYPTEGPRITINARGPWIAGETLALRMRLENPRLTPLEGQLDLVAGAIYKSENPPLSVHIPPRASREFSFPIEAPREVAENERVELRATFRERRSPTTWGWTSEVTLHHPFEYSLTPVESFPLREDQNIPIVHPTLATLNLPGEAKFQLQVKNWLAHEQVVTLTVEAAEMTVTPASAQLVLPAQGEANVELRAAPSKGSGLYRFGIRLHSGPYEVREGVALAAVRENEAIAYSFDYDRDGFDDVILENRAVRCYITPGAGGRAFAFVLKGSNQNAFNSVGGMRDSFTTRFEPDDMKDVADWTRVNWLGLYNRPYSAHIASASGEQAEVRMEYDAPDIYPKGVSLARTLVLRGDQNIVMMTTNVTPRGIEKPQAYVLENSVSFRSFDQANYRQWFAPGHPQEDFVPQRKIDLGMRAGYFGTIHKQTGETFALMMLTPAERSQLAIEGHSALVRSIYPAFAEKNRTYTYRVGYYLGKESPDEIEKRFAQLK
ncbi:MAG: alpha-amylase family protein [Terriglobia bacterium]